MVACILVDLLIVVGDKGRWVFEAAARLLSVRHYCAFARLSAFCVPDLPRALAMQAQQAAYGTSLPCCITPTHTHKPSTLPYTINTINIILSMLYHRSASARWTLMRATCPSAAPSSLLCCATASWATRWGGGLVCEKLAPVVQACLPHVRG